MTRREVLAATVVGGLVTTPGVARDTPPPLTPDQARMCVNGETVTVRFQVPRDFSAPGEGDLRLVNYESSDRQTGSTRFRFRAVLAERCRRDLGRVGVADMQSHFAGRVMTVRGQVSAVRYLLVYCS
jgi:hypothetical protein